MEAAIENIVSLTTTSNLVVNQLIERETIATATTKATFVKEPKWATVMAKNVHQVVSRVVETLVDAPKQEERKLNMRLMGFEVKEGETENEIVHRLNTELLQGQMRLRVKVVAAKRQWPATPRASTLTTSTRPGAVLLKFVTSKDRQAALRGRKGLAGTRLGLDEDLMPTQQACKSKLWPLFKEAKAEGKRAFWHAAELFVNGTQISPPSSI
ncbi:unnamed protein product [Sphagnum jensenii]|uniref:Uncharacterized protein n=1 Tax=Sphagnum jensenii TaxID=128206 RepID=A0ABP0VLZ6_9BRYO